MRITLVLPTLNELDNLKLLLPRLKMILHSFKNYELVVVDDNSVDGTGQYVAAYAKRNNKVRLIRRLRKKGLASAIFDGADAACGDFVVIMDADLQHDPAKIPELLKSLRSNDLTIGTRRYPLEKKTIRGRLLLLRSQTAIFLIRKVLSVRLKDPVSGYFAFRKALFDKVKNQLKPIGYEFLIDLYVKSKPGKVGFVIYSFGKRRHGKSKLGLKVMLCFFLQLFHLSWFRLRKKLMRKGIE